MLKIQFTITDEYGDKVYESGNEPFTCSKDAGILVTDWLDTATQLHSCELCENITSSDRDVCFECAKLVPDDSDYSSSVINEDND